MHRLNRRDAASQSAVHEHTEKGGGCGRVRKLGEGGVVAGLNKIKECDESRREGEV